MLFSFADGGSNRRRTSSPSQTRPPPAPRPHHASNRHHKQQQPLTRSNSAQPYHTSSTAFTSASPPRMSGELFTDARQRWSELARDRRCGLSLASDEMENATASIDSINLYDHGVRFVCTPPNFEPPPSTSVLIHPSGTTSETTSATSSVASAHPSPSSFSLLPNNQQPISSTPSSSSAIRPSSHHPNPHIIPPPNPALLDSRSTPTSSPIIGIRNDTVSGTATVSTNSPSPHLNFKVDYAELTALRLKFNQLDAEGKGFLSRSQFYELFTSFMDSSAHDPHHTPMFNFAYSLFQSAGDRLNLREFVTGMSVLSKGSEEERLRYLFMMYDKDGSGQLNADELKQVFRVMGSYAASHDFRASDSLDSQSLSSLRKINPTVLDELVLKTVKEHDVDGDGEIGLDDFIRWCGRDPVVKTWMDMLCYDTARGVARLRGESEKVLIARELQGLGIAENEFWQDSFNLKKDGGSTSSSATNAILPPTVSPTGNAPSVIEHSDSSGEFDSRGMRKQSNHSGVAGGGIYTPGTSNPDLERKPSHSNMTKSAIGGFEIDFRTLVFEKQIGSGSFAVVYKCKWLDSPVAVKVFKSGPRLVINSDGTPATVPTSSFMSALTDQNSAVVRGDNGGIQGRPGYLENGESFEPEFDSMISGRPGGGVGGQCNSGIQQSLFGDDMMETEISTNRVRFLQEISLLKSIRHPNLLLYMGACVNANYPLCIVSELIDGGSLFELLHGQDNVELSIRQKLLLTQDIARGMLYLHGRDPIVLHRDLKSANILVEMQNDDSFKGTIIDFGLSKLSSSTQQSLAPGRGRGLTGSLVTMAPEVMNELEYEPRSDVYSYAIICWEIWCRRIPFGKVSGPTQLLMKVAVQGARPEFEPHDDVPVAIQKLIRACWDQDVQNRPDFLVVVRTLNEIRHELKIDVPSHH